MSGIDSPADAFKFSYHRDTKNKVKQQLEFNSKIINNAITQHNYEAAAFYMKELREFQEKLEPIENG